MMIVIVMIVMMMRIRLKKRKKEVKINGMDLLSRKGRKQSKKKIKRKERIKCLNMLKRLLLGRIKRNDLYLNI